MERIPVLGFILVILYFITTKIECNGHTHIDNNVQSEQKALIDFKSGLTDPYNRLSSWKGSNYCYWQGIGCQNGTGFVVSIDLRNPYPYPLENVYGNQNYMNLSGVISPSLMKLKYLKYLDLSFNSFKLIPIPQFFGCMKNLIYLNLSHCGFIGVIPSNLGNLSNLQYLDFSSKYSSDLIITNIEWITSLVSLKHLSANNVNLSMVGSEWIEVLNKLPILRELHLDGCSLFGSIPSPSFVNFTSLSVIVFSSNRFNSTFPDWLLNVSSLVSIDISLNKLHGRIPLGLGELPNLQHLDIFGNYLEGSISQLLRKRWKKIEFLNLHMNDLHGSIPSSIGKVCNLKYLDLSYNNLNGSLPQIINGTETCNSKSPLPNLRELYLSYNQLMGKLPNWLGELKILRRLDLFYNKLEGPIPTSLSTLQQLEFLRLGGYKLNQSLLDGIGQLSQLKELVVCSYQLSGTLSEQHFWKLSNLEYLDLYNFHLNVSSNWVPPFKLRSLFMSSCHIGPAFPAWLQSQKNLHIIDLSNASISSCIPNWLWDISTNLQLLDLSNNQLQGSIPSSIGKVCNLKYLDLSDNNLNGSLLEIINGIETCNSKSLLPNLRELDLSSNQLMGKLSNWLGELKNLRRLNLFNNELEGPIPASLCTLQHLELLDLSRNKLNGSLPYCMGQFSKLEKLDVGFNQLSGTLSEQHFWKLSRLEDLVIDSNSFHLNVGSSRAPTFQLRYLSMGSCHIGPAFPTWLQYQKNLEGLDLSNASISSIIPKWFWNISSNLRLLILSHNQLQGTIPASIEHLTSLQVIDFSRNNLMGRIPSTINNCSSLVVLDLGNNFLSGMIPNSLGRLQYLESLHLKNNKLSGELPLSLQNLTSLDVLDLSYNKLSGRVPTWIGTALVNLVILNLRSNLFSGRLPSHLSNLSSLRVLDIAQNNLMGEIPITLAELKAMAQEHNMNTNPLNRDWGIISYEERLVVNTQGLSLEYTRTLSLVVSIDLSDNNLTGEFPQGITKLSGLVVLNLSRNHITGQIPERISRLKELLSLDLSSNKLFGAIPSSMASMSFLSYLNLSNNKLSGKIPFTWQMTTFTKSAYGGNPNLCGDPLTIKCQIEDPYKRKNAVSDMNNGGNIDQWFYMSVGLGFAVGILVPYFILAMRKSWCEAYFDFVDDIVKWLLRGRAAYAKNYPRRR